MKLGASDIIEWRETCEDILVECCDNAKIDGRAKIDGE
jgi:hypothetical protein